MPKLFPNIENYLFVRIYIFTMTAPAGILEVLSGISLVTAPVPAIRMKVPSIVDIVITIWPA